MSRHGERSASPRLLTQEMRVEVFATCGLKGLCRLEISSIQSFLPLPFGPLGRLLLLGDLLQGPGQRSFVRLLLCGLPLGLARRYGFLLLGLLLGLSPLGDLSCSPVVFLFKGLPSVLSSTNGRHLLFELLVEYSPSPAAGMVLDGANDAFLSAVGI